MRSRSLAALFVPLGALFVPRQAAGADGDAAAAKLRDAAIFDDYLATRFDDARSKLSNALFLCEGPSSCTAGTRARLHCDLGIIDFASQRPADGRAQFAAALGEDPRVTIDHDLSTPGLEREFAEVRARAGGPAEAASPGEETDCPPGFPGCHTGVERDDARGVEDDAAGEPARSEEPDAPFKKSWIGVGLELDALLLPSSDKACAGGTGYTCFGDTYYGALPLAGADDVVNGGVRLATKRVLVAYDRAVSPSFTVGARLGYAFGGGPQRPGGAPFEPIHAEVRASYWLGHDALSRAGLRLFVTASGGLAEVDASVPVDVYATLPAYRAGQSQNLSAWKKTGLGFVGLGLGVMYAVTRDSGVVFEARAMQMFPTAGTGAALQLGYAIRTVTLAQVPHPIRCPERATSSNHSVIDCPE